MDIQLEKKKGIQKKHIPYIAGGAVVILLLIWIIFGNHASTLRVDAASVCEICLLLSLLWESMCEQSFSWSLTNLM